MLMQALLLIKDLGHRGAVTSIDHMTELREAIQAPYREKVLSPDLYRAYLKGYAYASPKSLPNVLSIVVVAFRHPQYRLIFQRGRHAITVDIPPTYIRFEKTEAEILGTIRGVIEPEGHKVVRASGSASIPLKTLAVRSGLGQYGRNNLCYVEKMGSYHRLVAFYTDLPCDEDLWRKPVMMQECEDCDRCRRACPTGAIPKDRFLLRAERCITFRNESLEPFPDWIDPGWHSCLVGCMRCQKACPQNRHCPPDVIELGTFTEEETHLLLQSGGEALPDVLARKLGEMGIESLLEVIPRNLAALFARERLGPNP